MPELGWQFWTAIAIAAVSFAVVGVRMLQRNAYEQGFEDAVGYVNEQLYKQQVAIRNQALGNVTTHPAEGGNEDGKPAVQ